MVHASRSALSVGRSPRLVCRSGDSDDSSIDDVDRSARTVIGSPATRATAVANSAAPDAGPPRTTTPRTDGSVSAEAASAPMCP